MNYLLGLQTASQGGKGMPFDFGTDDSNGPADVKGLDALLKDTLAKAGAEAGKTSKNGSEQGLSPWNLLFPGIAPNTVTAEINPSNQPNAAPTSVDALLAKVGLARIEPNQPDQANAPLAGLQTATVAPPGMVHVNAQNPALHGARILQVETFDTRNAQTGAPFVGSSAQLQAQGALAANQQPVASPQTAAQRYTQVARGEAEGVAQRHAGPEFSAELATANKGERRESVAEKNATVDPTAAGLPAHNLTHGAGKTGEVQSNTAITHTVPQLMQRVGTAAHSGGGKMTVQLSPPELGKVEVQVTTRGKRVEIKMTSDSSLAKSVLESGMGDLRRQLEGQNLQLTHTEVQVSKEHFSPNQGQQQFSQQFASQHQQQNGSHSSRDERGGSQGGAFSRAESRRVEVPAVSARRVASAPGRVDVRI